MTYELKKYRTMGTDQLDFLHFTFATNAYVNASNYFNHSITPPPVTAWTPLPTAPTSALRWPHHSHITATHQSDSYHFIAEGNMSTHRVA